MAVNRFTGATNNNWGTATNWSQGTVPTATDTFTTTFDGTSPNCTVNTSARVCQILDFTGYTNTITMTNGITVSGNVTFVSTMSSRVSGSGSLTINATATITSNGGTWPNALNLNTASTTKTLLGNLIIGGTLTFSGGQTFNATTSETISVVGLTSFVSATGTATIIITGGTWTGGSTATSSTCAVKLQGNVTITSTISILSSSFTYVSGTIIVTGATLDLRGSGTNTLDTNPITWDNVNFNASGSTTTLNSLLSATTLTINNGTTFAGTSGFTVGTLSIPVIGATTVILKNGKTYTITTSLSAFGTKVGTILLITSDSAGNLAILTLPNNGSGVTCNVLASFTDIDASGGRTIITFNGTISASCKNIIERHDVVTVSG